MTGCVFNIQRFSTRDGPGIRTTVYLKGCNLACRWCHNPESIRPEPEMQYFRDRCASCLNCVAACGRGCHGGGADEHVFERGGCTACGACAEACRAGAMQLCGAPHSVHGLMEVVLRDAPYYENSGGGVTLSGGEPLLQPGVCGALFRSCRAHGIATALDTALNISRPIVESMLPLVDLWLVDVKHTDDARHRELTGVGNTVILANLERLLAAGGAVRVRVPLVRGLNDDVAGMEKLASLLVGAGNLRGVDLLPYHNYGTNKAASVGASRQAAEFLPPDADRLARLRDVLHGAGIVCEE